MLGLRSVHDLLYLHAPSVVLILHGVSWSLESIPRDSGHKVGDKLDGMKTYNKAQSRTFTHHLQCMCLDRWLDALKYPEEAKGEQTHRAEVGIKCQPQRSEVRGRGSNH